MENFLFQSCIDDYKKNPEITTEEKLSKEAL
jgi:hypothetical protein